ncbi:hypothetical protein [Streptomyces sp. NPDC087511]|uniref:hypothetical protein n=1 Tax=Streptomyces sp. NPDC087511 TaxID=3365792 RepID=UPI0037F5205A
MPSNRRWLRACSRPGTHGTGPRRGQLLAGDATVPKAPSKAEQATTEDTATGWVLSHRVDLAARVYYENAEKAKRAARGTKWLFASGHEDGYWRRVILAFCHVAGCVYEDEAAVAVRTFTRLSSHLPGCLGVLYNGAFRGTHPDALARQGLLVINKQHGATAPRAYEMLRYGRCRHDLWCQDGQIAERVGLDDGTSYASPAATVRVPVAITTTPADRTGTDRATGKRRPSDTERDFHRAEHLQQIPQSTLAHQLLYPYRSDAESLHNQLDQSLWNRR